MNSQAIMKMDKGIAEKKERYSLKKLLVIAGVLLFILHPLLIGGALGTVIGAVSGDVAIGALGGMVIGAVIALLVRRK